MTKLTLEMIERGLKMCEESLEVIKVLLGERRGMA